MSKQVDTEAYNTTPEETQSAVTQKVVQKGKRKVAEKAKQLGKLEVTYVKVTDIHPNNYNPNRQSEHDFELLLRSMQEDGFTQPIVALKDGTIVDGEHRWRAASSLGYKEIPVVYVDMTPEQMRIATLRHNRARGSEDIELSTQVLRDLQNLGALDWAKNSLMMSDDEINRLLEDIQISEALASPEFSPAWEPDSIGSKETSSILIEEKGMGHASTVQAANDLRAREKKLLEAKTEEERAKVREDTAIYRISLLFTSDQAVIIRAVLGNQPAERLYELCTKAYEEGNTA